jgi:hypothetical protein
MLVFQSTQMVVQSGVTLWSGPRLIGGCAAVVVGLGVLFGWGAFDVDSGETGSSTVLLLAGIAVLSFVVGRVLAVV